MSLLNVHGYGKQICSEYRFCNDDAISLIFTEEIGFVIEDIIDYEEDEKI